MSTSNQTKKSSNEKNISKDLSYTQKYIILASIASDKIKL